MVDTMEKVSICYEHQMMIFPSEKCTIDWTDFLWSIYNRFISVHIHIHI